MKFQNPSFKFSLNGRTNTQTHKRTSRKQYAPHFFKVGGIIKELLQRRACKLILGHEYKSLLEAFERLKIRSFDQSIFLSKAKMMYKIHNNIAPCYLNNERYKS